jgi:signal transduction histidine kinase
LPVPSPVTNITQPRKLRLLLVEDSEADAELLLRQLRRHGFEAEPTRVDSRDALVAALAREWDLIISDYNMPGFSGTEALGIVRQHTADVPFILVSGSIGEEHAVEAMRAGAGDFVTKTKLHRLAPAVERELREAEHRAEQRRTAEALVESQNQLRQAQKLEAIGRLAGGIAHDFNNLLTVILGFADLVLADLESDNQHREDVQEIRNAAARAVDLTRQLLAFSRQQVLDPAVVNLGGVVEDVARLLKRVIGADIVISTTTPPDLWLVKADRTQLDQIVMNLAVNARDAMRSGGTLSLETANVVITEPGGRNQPPTPGMYVMLRTRDSGEGIPADVLPKIFEPFFTTKLTGSGLGLSMVYGIVQQSGGRIFVDSTPGAGTAFTIYLPRATEGDIADAAAGPGPAQPGRGTILLVEDDRRVRDLALRVLTQHGYDVIAAADADTALRSAAQRLPTIDLLLTDIVMPGMSGLALAERLRSVRPSLRVVFMSGFSGKSQEELQRHGNPEILSKPFTPAALARRVREALTTTP